MHPTSTVRVNLAERSYDVLIGHGLLPLTGHFASEILARKKCAVITDSTVGPLYAKTVLDSLLDQGITSTLITVPAGEASKSMAVVEDVCRQMLRAGLDRKSFLIALGGGVIGDLAGFAASIFLRGIPFIQVPTTVLSQVDSSVGGKTGVNTPEGKNLLGTFSQPSLVLADVDTLKSLPSREHHEGFAEIIKHAAIRDAAMFNNITTVKEGHGDMSALIQRNVAIKARIVEADAGVVRALQEQGSAATRPVAGRWCVLHSSAASYHIVVVRDGVERDVAGRQQRLVDAGTHPPAVHIQVAVHHQRRVARPQELRRSRHLFGLRHAHRANCVCADNKRRVLPAGLQPLRHDATAV